MNKINYEDYMDNDKKVYIPVLEVRQTDGSLLPKAFRWIDGTLYRIDKVLGNEPAATLKGGRDNGVLLVILEGKEYDKMVGITGFLIGLSNINCCIVLCFFM